MTDFVDQLRAQGKPALADAAEIAIEKACAKADKAIQKILLDLERDTLRRVVQVNVDTRNFANCAVDIILDK